MLRELSISLKMKENYIHCSPFIPKSSKLFLDDNLC